MDDCELQRVLQLYFLSLLYILLMVFVRVPVDIIVYFVISFLLFSEQTINCSFSKYRNLGIRNSAISCGYPKCIIFSGVAILLTTSERILILIASSLLKPSNFSSSKLLLITFPMFLYSLKIFPIFLLSSITASNLSVDSCFVEPYLSTSSLTCKFIFFPFVKRKRRAFYLLTF